MLCFFDWIANYQVPHVEIINIHNDNGNNNTYIIIVISYDSLKIDI